MRFLICVVAWLCFAQPEALRAQLPAAQLTSVFPAGGQQGTTISVAIAGSDLDEAEQLSFGRPGIVGTLDLPTAGEKPVDAKAQRFKVAIEATTPPGFYEARVKGRFGLSNPRVFVVGKGPERIDDGTHHSVETAAALAIPATVHGRTTASMADFFRLDLTRSQRILVSVVSKQIDSRLEATLVVLDKSGKELHRSRADRDGKLLLDFAPPADGAYVLKLFDAVYGGGENHFYRLTVDTQPVVDFVFPPSGPAGSSNQYFLFGHSLPGGVRDEKVMSDGRALERVPFIIPLPKEDSPEEHRLPSGLHTLAGAWLDAVNANWPPLKDAGAQPRVYVSQLPTVVVEQEPNGQAAPQRIAVPCEFTGQFYPAGDVDGIEFEARGGDTYWLEMISSQMGVQSDPALVVVRVEQKEGKEQLVHIADADDTEDRNRRIGENFDATSDDPLLKLKFPADGTYRVVIRDQLGEARNEPGTVYRLAIRPPQPDFRLLAFANPPPATQQLQNVTALAATVLRRGGTAAVGLSLLRRDEFEGEVAVTVEGLPAGVTCSGAVLGGSVTEGSLVFVAAEDASAWAGPIKIVGHSRIGEREVVREARYGVAVWGTPNRLQESARFRLSHQMHVSVVDHELEPALVQVGEDRIYEVTLGGKLEIPVTVARRGDFKEAIKLVPIGLPQQLRPKDVTLDAKREATFEFPFTGQGLKPGAYTFYFKGETKYKYARNPQAVAVAEAEQKRLAELVTKLAAEAKAASEGASESSLKMAQEQLKQAESQKAEAEKRVAEAKQIAQPKDLSIALVSTPIRLRILPNPNQK